ncbi:MAG: FKBP-type peptidyl-prolyl cis-trans isomerase 2 [Sphingobacteriales bacterium]|jgi:FKBP-type peptidyl-prolyl cis-trans isomerase 2
MSQVKATDTVKLHYTGTLKTGQVFDSSLEREPLEVKLGQGQLIPGFEKALVDMTVSEKKTFEIPTEEAYGVVREELVQEVEKNQLPQDMEPETGMGLASRDEEGNEMRMVITEIKEETIVVDANHPLAGQDLTFEIELLEII